ncbi:hypothetical protein ACJIZ3_006924 [Penstemon smallii]|uniref:Ribonuclease II-like barrel domain-containing protein n=1 Tax=Penstemon smallii TaxID=265156 RepID=A0ABD3S916_9LAMI
MRNISEKETPNFLLPVYPFGEPLILFGTVLLRITCSLFRKDAERVVLAVAHIPDGKKNWMVIDQVLIKQ